jgi:hypothetical protein
MSNVQSYNALIDRFKAFASGHFILKRFSHGQIEVSDLEKFGEYPFMHVIPSNVTYSQGMKTFSFQIVLADLPRDKEDKSEYQREALSDLQRIAEDLIAEITNHRVLFGDLITVNNVSLEPFLEEFQHTLTGWTVSLDLLVPYYWDACSIPAEWNDFFESSTGGTGSILTFIDSITRDENGNVSLVNDEAEPSPNYYYGTNNEGVRGWYLLTDEVGLTCVTLPSCQTIIDIEAAIDDLQEEILLKANTADISAVGFSNDYNDLDNKPSIPSIDGLVPYTGATQDVDLGVNNIYTNKVYLLDEANDNYGSIHYTDGDFHIEDADGHKLLVIEDGFMQLHLTDTIQSNLFTTSLTQTRDHYLPNQSGTIALTSDIPAAQVNSDWNATSGVAQILNKPIIPSIAGLVPETRTLTINGTTQDLSANRTFTIATGLTVGTTPITSGTVGRVLFEGTGNVLQESANFFWDNTNSRLGIGTASPAYGLDIVGTARVSSSGVIGGTPFASSRLEVVSALGVASQEISLALNKSNSNDRSWKFLLGKNADTQWGTYSLRIFNGGYSGDLVLGLGTGRLRIGAGFPDTADSSANFTDRLNIFANGNFAIGTTTDAGFRLDVNGTARVSGNTTINGFCFNNGIFSNSGVVNIYHRQDISVGVGIQTNSPTTTVARTTFAINDNFAPTSGTNTYSNLTVQPIINQTGTASGISRGIYIAPTLTSAADFRAIEVVSGTTVLAPSVTARASLRIPSGTAPTSPLNGDIWFDGTNIQMRIGGVTRTFTLI